MELALTIFNVGAGLGILAVGVAVAYLAWRVTPLIAETRALTRDVRRLTRTMDGDLRPLLDRARDTARAAELVTEDAALGLLLAPQTGDELREQVGGFVEGKRAELDDAVNEGRAAAEQAKAEMVGEGSAL